MTKVNNPKVITVKGRVNIVRIGLMIVFTIPNTTDTIKAVTKLSIRTPVRIYPVTKTAKALTNKLTIILIRSD